MIGQVSQIWEDGMKKHTLSLWLIALSTIRG